MRRYSKRSSVRGYGREAKSKYKWSRPGTGNSNWQYDLAQGAWSIWEDGDPTPFGAPTRVLTINSGDTNPTDPQSNVYVKQLVFDLGFHAGISTVRTSGGRVEYNAAARDDIGPGVFYDGSTPGGILLDGGHNQAGTRQAPQSYVEGITICWALLYEDTVEADGPFWLTQDGFFEPNEPQFVEKNKNIFKRGTFQVAAYKPAMVRIRHRFTGRGVQLMQGSREITQITLALWAWQPGGSLVPSLLGMVPADVRYQYLDND